MKKRVYITLHGYKRPQWDDFHILRNKLDTNSEIVVFDYYDSTNKELINKRLWWDNILNKIAEYKDYDVTLIGYSVGAVAAIAASAEFDNVDQVYAITPAVRTKMLSWVFKGIAFFPYYLPKKLINRIKLGKVEYGKYKKAMSRGASEKYPMAMTWEVHRFKMWLKKKFPMVQDKNIRIVYANADGIIHVNKTSNYIKHKLIHNTIKVETLNVSHHLILEEESPLYEDIKNFIKEN